MKKKEEISWDDFQKIDMRSGRIINVEDFPEARKPSYKITVDFGPYIGQLKTSAQLKNTYSKEELLGRQIIGVVNFSPKQIANFMSEFLITGFVNENNKVFLAIPDKEITNGTPLS